MSIESDYTALKPYLDRIEVSHGIGDTNVLILIARLLKLLVPSAIEKK